MNPNDPLSPSYLLNVTDSIKSKGENQLYQAIGFRVHRVKVGSKPALVKVYDGLPPGSVDDVTKDLIHNELLEDLRNWKKTCSREFFAKLIGYCDSEDSLLPASVLEAKNYAYAYLRTGKNIGFFDFCSHLAQGFAYLHSKVIAHGDIRVDNILINAKGNPVIADYGLSRVMRMVDRYRIEPKTDISPTRWMPIEWIQLDSDDIREPTITGDVWSFGMTLLELWSLHHPYFGIKPERVSVMIHEHKTPAFPCRANVWNPESDLKVKFVCKLCWRKSPSDRKPMSELAVIINELKTGIDLDAIKRSFASEAPLDETESSCSSPPSLSRSYVSAVSDPSMTESRYYGPGEGSSNSAQTENSTSSSSGSVRTIREARGSPRIDTVSEWSTLRRANVQNLTHGAYHASENLGSGSSDESNVSAASSIPPPPPPDDMWASISSKKTAFLNYVARKGVKAEIKSHNKGEPHSPVWTVICNLNGRQYAKFTSSGKKKDAEEEVARMALERLSKEYPSAGAIIAPSYLSTFNAYLHENELSERFEWQYYSEGEPHLKTWTCEIYDKETDTVLGTGTGAKKSEASEEAARNAARMWGNPRH